MAGRIDPITRTITVRSPGERAFRVFTERMGGGIAVWEPPHRVVYSWKPNDNPTPPTELEVRFTTQSDGTLVVLEHRGWERLGDWAERIRPLYASDGGWTMVLGRFRNAAESGA